MTGTFVDRRTLARRVGVHPGSITRYMREYADTADPFPPPDHHAGRSPAWREDQIPEVRAWIGRRRKQHRASVGRPRKQKGTTL